MKITGSRRILIAMETGGDICDLLAITVITSYYYYFSLFFWTLNLSGRFLWNY